MDFKLLIHASPKGGPLLSFANGIWVDRYAPLKPSFVNTIHTKYAAVALSVDFQNEAEKAQGEINAWVRSETNETIKEILPPGAVNERTKCVLANALYFKGVWQKQFDASCTVDEDFYLMDGTTVRTQMMTSSKKQEITKFESFKVLRLPYNQGADGRLFSMYFVLPNDKIGLPGLVKTINADFIEQKLVKSKEVKVGSFKLPKFRVSSKFEMPDFLVKLGLSLPFSSQANFSNMVETPMGHSLSIGKVYHKAMVEVNEEGTEASAATAAVVLLRSIQFDEKEDFVADHPFLYILKEDITNIVVFIGHIVNPSIDG
ncbi:hypothetical protein KP509_19G072400 [Ceratopteris richardii]|uniref:Serpin domain-containing protein n=1 Tax=Ceratopteris richardii TaxID=49495 RepID=A0A8T2SN48_CERRI|nr:hypothetical protein KP509_19G072400 [Ceratopteris richardii]